MAAMKPVPEPSLAARLQRGLDRHHAAKLAMRTGLRRHRNRRHAGEFPQPRRKLMNQLERARHGGDGLQRVDIGEAGQPGQLLVQPRFVLHRAGAKRERAGVDGEVLRRQPHVMPQGLGLAETRQADRLFTFEPAQARREIRRLVEVDAGRAGAADLEDQRLLDLQPAIAGEGRMRRDDRLADRGRPSLAVHHRRISVRVCA
jgi:hypothetical protein